MGVQEVASCHQNQTVMTEMVLTFVKPFSEIRIKFK